MAEILESLGDRKGWTVDSGVATYCPHDCGWTARVRPSSEARYYARWHVAIIDPHGRARWVTHASLLTEAARVAEGRVRAMHHAAV